MVGVANDMRCSESRGRESNCEENKASSERRHDSGRVKNDDGKGQLYKGENGGEREKGEKK